jgi:tyrosine-protein kinase Etk/Wzc
MSKNKIATAENKQPSQGIFETIAYKYLPFWYLFLLFFLLSGALAFMYLKTTPKVYESKASILVKDEKKGQEESRMEEVLNPFDSKKIVENEIEVLRSNPVVLQVVKDLSLYAPVYTEKGWKGLITRSAYVTSPVKVELLDPSRITPVKKIYFTFHAADSSVTLDKTAFPLNTWMKTAWGTMRFVANKDFNAEKAAKLEDVKFYFELKNMAKAADELSGDLVTVPTSKQSSVINLKIKDEVPQRGEAILTGLIHGYNLLNLSKKNKIAANTLQFIDERLKVVSAELDSVEGKIQTYRNKVGAVDLSEQSRLYLQGMEENDQKRNQIKMQASVLDEVQKYIDDKSGDANYTPATAGLADPTVNQLLDKLHTAQSQYDKLKKTTGEDNPIVSSLQTEIAKTKNEIQENIRSQRDNIKVTQANLDQISNRYVGMASTIPQKERELVDVSRARNTKQEIYAFLLQKREETSYSINAQLPDSFIVDFPNSTIEPISPKPALIALLALMIPIVLGLGIISLKEAMVNNILYRSDIEKFTTHPVVGEILQEKFEDPLVTASNARSYIIEQFRLLRSSIKNLSAPPGAYRTIIVTSSVAGEGKSFIASNIANTFARSGKKVAILEIDLHKPKLSETFNIDREPGITDYLMGTASESQIVKKSMAHENLFLVPSGSMHDDASELLLNGRIETLMAYMKSKFDIVILDTAPINPITDYYTLAPYCDLTLYVVRHAVTPKMHIQHLDEHMEAHKVGKIAIVFNGVKKRGSGKYSYGYGYGYGYDYRANYGEYTQKKMKKVG